MESLLELKTSEYKRFRWFYTSSGKLVVGGKNANSNDELMIFIRKFEKDFLAMHTQEPGSSFSIIIENVNKVTKKDKMECAIFTASFSRAWKEGKKNASVNCFSVLSTYKTKSMPAGTWGVQGKFENIEAPLELILTKQEGILRAVPQSVIKRKSEAILRVKPGNKDKQELIEKIRKAIGAKHSDEEILSALPAGGINLEKPWPEC